MGAAELPTPPESPFAELARMRTQIRQGSLQHAEQVVLLERLEAEIKRHDDETAKQRVYAVLRDLRAHDLRHSLVLRIDALLARSPSATADEDEEASDAQTLELGRAARWQLAREAAKWRTREFSTWLRKQARAMRSPRRTAFLVIGLGVVTASAALVIVLAGQPPEVTAFERDTASLRIYNSGTRSGLAEALARDLECGGWSVETVDNLLRSEVRTSTVFFRDDFEEKLAGHLSAVLGIALSERPSSVGSLPPGPLIVVTNDFDFQPTCRRSA